MKHHAMPAAIAMVGLGLMSIGLNLDGNRADATPAALTPAGGPAEPTIVWYGWGTVDATAQNGNGTTRAMLCRAWSDGRVEGRVVAYHNNDSGSGVCNQPNCITDWIVISSPNEGLNAQADINFDARVDAADLGMVLAAWGDAPRNDLPPSDCPLGLIP